MNVPSKRCGTADPIDGPVDTLQIRGPSTFNRDLGDIAPGWRGWKLWNGLLWSPEGDAFAAGEVRAIPLRAQLVAELERRVAMPTHLDLL